MRHLPFAMGVYERSVRSSASLALLVVAATLVVPPLAGAAAAATVALESDANVATAELGEDGDRARAAIVQQPLDAGAPTDSGASTDIPDQPQWTRTLGLEGAKNFRDLGGYQATDGRRVKWRQLFRSNRLSELTERDYGSIGRLGIKLVYDLRTASERRTRPTRWVGETPEFLASPKKVLDPDLARLMRGGSSSVAEARTGIIAFYESMPTLYAPEVREVFAHLLTGRGPILFHCSSGKDRSGFMSAVILRALGVPRETILADYVMSAELLDPGERDRTPSARDEIEQVTSASDPAYIEAAFDSIEREYGSFDAYLEREIGVGSQDRARLQSLFLE